MYAKESEGEVEILCKAPIGKHLNIFWKEVQEYMDKGYRYEEQLSRKRSPVGMRMQKVILMAPKEENIVDVIEKTMDDLNKAVAEPKEDNQVSKHGSKTSTKKDKKKKSTKKKS